MNRRSGARAAVAVTIVVAVLLAPLMIIGGLTEEGNAGEVVTGALLLAVLPAVSLLGAMIVRRTGNVIGWIFVAMPLAVAVAFGTEAYVRAGYRPPESLPAVDLVAWASQLSAIAIVLPIPLLFLLFPTGTPIGPRWRWAVRAWAAGGALIFLGAGFRQSEVYGSPSDGYPGIENPLALPGPEFVATAVLNVGAVLVLLSTMAGIASLVLRFRRARGDERQQLRWIALVAITGGALFLTMLVLDLAGQESLSINEWLWPAMVIVLLVGLPVAVAVAVLKYRLYSVDVVISKTLVYGSLGVFITLVYVAIVVGVGSLLGRRDDPNVALQVLATAIVAVAFQPFRERAQRLANRFVYGKRSSPYEVLSRFSDRVAGTYATEDVLPRTALVIAEGTGASRVDVWLRVGDELRPAASWPDDVEPKGAVPLAEGAVPRLGADRTAEIRLGEELIGAVTVDKPPNEPIRPAEERLLDDLASQAGLVLSNVRLTAELEANLERIAGQAQELRASRQRIVAAQDQERRRLERNIHDGAQQHLVALAVKLRLARGTIAKDPAKARGMLLALQEEIGDALDTLTSLALGIYPPLLEEQGLAAALAAHYLRIGLPVHLTIDGATRYPLEIEGAVYFCVLEALQNAAKYARASRIDVTIGEAEGELRFEVVDDGVGFDGSTDGAGTGLKGMLDRLAVFGGHATVDSAPGHGTTVRGRVPLAVEAAGR